MPNNCCARCGLPSSQQGHYFPTCNSPAWWEGRTGKPWDEANKREFHQCCPAPYGCSLDAVPQALLWDERTALRAAVEFGRDNGFVLRRDRSHYAPRVGRVKRWTAVKPSFGQIVLECWTNVPDQLSDERWRLRVSSAGTVVEVRERLTLAKALDAIVLAGLLPENMSTFHALGVEDAANAIEAHAESIGWYEGGGVWADAIEEARKAVKL